MKKFKKIALYSIASLALLIVIIILFISPITKYLIEKYDEKYTGRQITMGWAYVNPFTGSLHFSNLKIYEFKSDSIFFSANGLSANVTMTKLLNKTYEINKVTLDKPHGIIIQNKKLFNFNDLINKFTSKGDSTKPKAPVHFSILNIKIINGEFYYRELITPVYYFIKNVTIESSGIRWDVDSIPVKFSFLSGIGTGDVKGDFSLNLKNNDYKLAIIVRKFDLNIVGQYIKDLSNYGSFRAYLDTDFKSSGNFKDPENVTIAGQIQISDFHFGKNPKEDYASFDKLAIAINELSPKKRIYFCDSIALSHPYFKYERYDYLDNVQTMFGKKGSNLKSAKANEEKFNLVIEIADYIRVLSKNFLSSNYKVNRLAIYNGDIKFNDYSLNEKFAIELSPLYFIADSIKKTNKRVNFNLQSSIKPYGDLAVAISINPKDSSDFDLQYTFQKLPITAFNPYLIKFTSYPLDRGTIELKGKWTVRNGLIKSDNNLLIIDPRVSKRLKNKNINWLPMRIILFFVRERGNVIDYKIPISGNLKDPKFHLRDVIFDAIENIFVKPVTTPYTIEVRTIEAEIEKALSLKWEMRSSLLTPRQEKFLERMSDFLTENPEASITVSPQNYTTKEKEYILFYEAKKKYYLQLNNKNNTSFNEEDSIKVNKMSIKEAVFVEYLNKHTRDSMLFTVQQKCIKLVGTNFIDKKFKELNSERINVFMAFFKDIEIQKRIKLTEKTNVIPFNGFSFYKIEYKGEFPESLIKAYEKMNELNNESPRKKFEKERRKIKKIKGVV